MSTTYYVLVVDPHDRDVDELEMLPSTTLQELAEHFGCNTETCQFRMKIKIGQGSDESEAGEDAETYAPSSHGTGDTIESIESMLERLSNHPAVQEFDREMSRFLVPSAKAKSKSKAKAKAVAYPVSGEPDAEPTAMKWTLNIEDRTKDTIVQKELKDVEPTWTVAKLRDTIVEFLGIDKSDAKRLKMERVETNDYLLNTRKAVKTVLVDGDTLKITIGGRGGAKKPVKKDERIATSKVQCLAKAQTLTSAAGGSSFNPRVYEGCFNTLMNDDTFIKTSIAKMTEPTIRDLLTKMLVTQSDGTTKLMPLREVNILKLAPFFVPEVSDLHKIKEGATSTIETLEKAFMHNLTLTFYVEGKEKNDYSSLIEMLKLRAHEFTLPSAQPQGGHQPMEG